LTFEEIKKNKEINEFINKGNYNLGLLGYTDHSQIHCSIVADTAAMILKRFGYCEHDIELAKIAGYMHDIGNAINRSHHAEYGGLLANEILKKSDMDIKDRITIVSAISNHDESTGGAVDVVSAALIIADKTDVRRNRVQNLVPATFDIHDRVNYAALSTKLTIQKEKKVIQMELELDDEICTVMDYFEIFLERMIMCRRAAERLDCKFKLIANGNKMC
jgi:metal-dependent HD superfamily phosphatase/phosphodiesterase